MSRARRRTARRSRAALPAPRVHDLSPATGDASRRRGLLRVVRPVPTLLAVAVTLALIPLANRDAPLARYLQLGLGMLCFQLALGAAWEAAERRRSPGDGSRAALPPLLAAGFAGAGLFVTLPLDPFPWLAGLGGLACGLLHHVALRRTSLAWLPLALAGALLPAWIIGAVDAWSHLLWWVFPLALFLGLALHLASRLPEPAPGSSDDARAVARRSFAGALTAFGAGLSIACVVLAVAAPRQGLLLAIAGVIALLLAGRAARRFGRDGLVGVIAASGAIAAVLFLSAA